LWWRKKGEAPTRRGKVFGGFLGEFRRRKAKRATAHKKKGLFPKRAVVHVGSRSETMGKGEVGRQGGDTFIGKKKYLLPIKRKEFADGQ